MRPSQWKLRWSQRVTENEATKEFASWSTSFTHRFLELTGTGKFQVNGGSPPISKSYETKNKQIKTKNKKQNERNKGEEKRKNTKGKKTENEKKEHEGRRKQIRKVNKMIWED